MRNFYLSILPALLFIFIAVPAAGQTVRERADRLQQEKMSFFNEKLQLTKAESEKFWPVYNDYQNRRDKITRDRNNLLIYFDSNKDNLSENETHELINKYIAFQKDETMLLETYTKRFMEFLPAQKVMRIFLVELEFKKWLLDQLRENRVQSRN
jgi:hypothetical protein